MVSSSEKSTSRLIFNPCLNFSHVHFLQYNKCGPLQKKKRCKIKIVCWIWPIPPKIINLIKMLIRSFHNSNQCYIPPSSFFFFFLYTNHIAFLSSTSFLTCELSSISFLLGTKGEYPNLTIGKVHIDDVIVSHFFYLFMRCHSLIHISNGGKEGIWQAYMFRLSRSLEF